MPKAISMVTFIDRDDDDKVYQLKVTVNNDFSVESEYVGEALPQLTEIPKPKKEKTLGDKVEGLIDGLTGGKLKKCGGCARRKALLDKLGGSNEQVAETSRDAN
tara:strand:+ start:2711 stop:3022 length:312 start_codon:yes stop_codon:yes gene_type:complete